MIDRARIASIGLETENLEHLAISTFDTLMATPQEFVLDPELIKGFLTPLESEALSVFEDYHLAVNSDRALGINVFGSPDYLYGENASDFVGKYKTVDLLDSQLDPNFASGISEGFVPSIIFETVDINDLKCGVAQAYLHVGVPLVGSLIDIEKISF